MKIIKLINILSLIFLFNIFPSFAENNPEKDLIASALKIYKSISNDEDIKTRINKKELVIKKLDEIIDFHGSTDIGLELISTGESKGLNLNNIRTNYLSELLSYSLKTCKSEPNFNCLGFISLENGKKECDNAISSSQYLKATNHFSNAYRIFNSQGLKDKYKLAVFSSYKNCTNKVRSPFYRDYVNSRIINLLLETGDKAKALGITQNMRTTAFKVLSAAEIRIYENKYDYPTFAQLLKKTTTLEDYWNQEIVALSLINKFYKTGNDPFDRQKGLGNQKIKQGVLNGWNRVVSKYDCTPKFDYITELAMDFYFLENQSGFKRDKFWAKTDGYPILTTIRNRAAGCPDSPTYNVSSIIRFIKDNPVAAKKIRNYQKERGLDDSSASSDFFKSILSTEEILQWYKPRYKYWLEDFEERPSYAISNMKSVLYPYFGDEGNLEIFKVLVDGSEICLATGKLFREIRGTKSEDQAVSYIINSTSFTPEKKYVCGDAELDLLIN